MKERVFEKRKDWVWIIILSFIVLIPNISLCFFGSDFDRAPMAKIIMFLFVSLLLFFTPSFFLKAKVFFLVQGIFVLLAPLELAHIYQNKMVITVGFLQSILLTNIHEISELLSAVKIPILLLILLWIFYFYITLSKVENTYLIKSKKIKIYLLGLVCLTFVGGYGFYLLRAYKSLASKEDVISKSVYYFTRKFYKIYPYDLIIQSYQVYAIQREVKRSNARLMDFQFHAKKKNNPIQEKEVYLCIIGETGRYSSFSLNGYERETSPLLEKISNIISYSDFFAESNITQNCLPLMLTRATPKDFEQSNKEKSFVEAFKEAGFKTYWIANQSSGNPFVKRIAYGCDEEYFATIDFDAATNFDENLWPPIEKVLSRNENKVFIVVHTLGSHFRYNFRYPPEFNRYQPSFQGAFDYGTVTPKVKELLVNSYDNTILYTDYFLANTIHKIDSLNCISTIVYLSDHGENLYDDERKIALHASLVYTEYDFHIPFMVWSSEKYNQAYPSKIENIKLNKYKKLSSNNLFYSILDIADVSFPGLDFSKSIASPTLQEDSIRYILTTNMKVKTGF